MASGRGTALSPHPSNERHASNMSFGCAIRRIPRFASKKVGKYWSARVTDGYRAVGTMDGDTVIWFFIETHDEYKRTINRA